VLEAMAVGRPVVGMKRTELEELVRDGETGFLLDPADKRTLAMRTRTLLDDPGLARRLGEAGQQRVLSLSVDALMPIWASAYAGLSGPESACENTFVLGHR
jgi:glycosyltransferase involved in cell wall biosynthesis